MIEDNTQHYLQLKPEKGSIFERVDKLRTEIKKFVSLFLYSTRNYFKEESDLNVCIIHENPRWRGYMHEVQNQFAGLLGLLSIALPNRDLLFHLSGIPDHEYKDKAHEFYTIFSKSQQFLEKYSRSEFVHPKFSLSFKKKSQRYIQSYLTYIYWRHINIPNIQNELKFPIEILENIVSFM